MNRKTARECIVEGEKTIPKWIDVFGELRSGRFVSGSMSKLRERGKTGKQLSQPSWLSGCQADSLKSQFLMTWGQINRLAYQ